MTKRAGMDGKVRRAPDPDTLRSRNEAWAGGYDPHADFQFGSTVLDNSTRSAAKAELVRLGVDGDVPLAQARVNAGLDAAVVWAMNPPASDNQKIAVAA